MSSKKPNSNSGPQRGLGAKKVARNLGGSKAHRSGNGWDTICPCHEDTKPSLSVADREDGGLLFHCQAGCKSEDVIAELEARGMSVHPPPERDSRCLFQTTREKHNGWSPVLPVPENAPALNVAKDATIWTYRNENGRTQFLIVRNDACDSSKVIRPFSFCRSAEGLMAWRQKLPCSPRTIYKLDELTKRPDDPVLVVEGEKTAEAAAALFPGYVVVTSCGGSNAARQTDWSPLKGRNIVVWPDNDDPGAHYMSDVAFLANEAGASEIRTIAVPSNWPPKWDLADELPDGIDEDELEQMLANAEVYFAAESETNPCEQVYLSNSDPISEVPDWPKTPEAAMRGLAGDFVQVATENSEADPMAVLGTLLPYFGIAAGRNAHLWIGDTQHHTRLFSAIVGASSRARKGTSASPVLRLFQMASEMGGDVPTFIPGPLSSGEGLINAIRDPSAAKNDSGEPIDPGVEDKRLMVVDGELASALRAMKRDGNTLSTALRTAWDGGDLAPLTKTTPIRASRPHIGIVAHITRHELLKTLEEAEIWGGTGNRFLFILARRQRLVALPHPIEQTALEKLAKRLAETINTVRLFQEITLSNEAKLLWEELYPKVSRDHSGQFGTMTARAEAQVTRLALVYALLDKSKVIEKVHLEAGLSFWNYCRASVAFIFDRKQNPLEIKVLNALAIGPQTTTELHRTLHGHAKGEALQTVLKDLVGRSIVDRSKEPTKGKVKTIWRLRKPT